MERGGRFQNYKTNCPYLVESYERVAQELASYIAAGYRTPILDIPPNREELTHINVVLTKAKSKQARLGERRIFTNAADRNG
jgi:alkanesulfonate monooxygenase